MRATTPAVQLVHWVAVHFGTVMGKRITACFAEAEKVGGLIARIRLATRMQIFSGEAEDLEDSPEVIEKMERALDALRMEFGKPPVSSLGAGHQASLPTSTVATATVPVNALLAALPASPDAAPTPSTDKRASTARRGLTICADLMAQRLTLLRDPELTMRRVTEAASSALNVHRASVWLCDAKRTKLTCACLFERTHSRFSSGMVLQAADFPAYFLALRTERTIAAHDACRDVRTAAFSSPYLVPLGIKSLLDIPLWVDGRMAGVLCHENLGTLRQWDSDEETVGYLLSTFVALALERAPSPSQDSPASS